MRTTLSVLLAIGLAAASPASQATETRSQQQKLLQALLDDWRASTNTPGAALAIVARNGDVTALTSGVSDKGTSRQLAVDDLMMAGSTGKTFFAAVALQLIEARSKAISTHFLRSSMRS